jgi:hypothetical protein
MTKKSDTGGDLDDYTPAVCDGGDSCTKGHIKNPATCRCVPLDSALGKILLRNADKNVDISDETSFPAYADQVIRDQVSSISSKLSEHSATNEKLQERIETLTSRVLGNSAKLDELAVIKARLDDHEETIMQVKEIEKNIHALNINSVDLKALVEKSLSKAHEIEVSNAELRQTFATLGGVAEKLETMRNEFFQHVAKIEEVSKSNLRLEGVEVRVKEDARMMLEMREVISEATSETKDALHAAKTTRDEADLIKNEVNKTFMMIEDSRKAMEDAIVTGHNEREEMKKAYELLKTETMGIKGGLEELEKRALSAIQEMGASLMSQMQSFVDAKKKDVELEFRRAEQESEKQVDASAKVAAEIVQKEVMHASEVAKAALAAATETMTKIDMGNEALKHQEQAAEAAVDAAQKVIENELERVQADVVGMERAAMETVEKIETRLKEVEDRLADEAANIQNELASASDVMKDQEYAVGPIEGHHVHHHEEDEAPIEESFEHVGHSADDPERTMVVERAEEEARSLHNQVTESRETLAREEEALREEQRKADADYAVAKELYKEAEAAQKEVATEEREMNHLSTLLSAQETEAMKHPTNENVVEAMEQTQAEIQQLESNLEIVRERSSELEREYAKASEAVDKETQALEEDSSQFQSDKQAALVYTQEEEQADSLLRQATNAYMHSESDVSPPLIHPHFEEPEQFHLPHHSPTMSEYEHAAHSASLDKAQHHVQHQYTDDREGWTDAEKYLGHRLKHVNVEDAPWMKSLGQAYARDGPVYSGSMSGGSRSLNEAQKRETESLAMKTLLQMGIKPMSEGYKKLMAFVRQQAENAGKVVFITTDVIDHVLLGRKSS